MVERNITLAQMREMLPAGEEYTDEFLTRLRHDLYEMAELALDCYFESKKRPVSPE